VKFSRFLNSRIGPDAQRKWQLIGDDGVADRADGRKIVADREHVVARHFGVGGVGHGRKKTHAAASTPIVHRRNELVIGPVSNPGFGIGRDVRSIKVAERRLQDQSAGKGLSVRRRMTCRAVGEDGEIASTLYAVEGLAVPQGIALLAAQLRTR
jgi:hypothetical protein